MIKDVKIVDLLVNVDDRGYLIEILRASDEYFTKFGQVYIVGDNARNIIRAFHVHEVLWDWFFISHGSAKFALVDRRKNSPTFEEINTFILTDRKPQLLIIPPGIYHGWMSLEDDTQMISTASEVYNRENPDEKRVPYDSFGYDWSIKFK
ncbi:MAG: dTDP-4-dehydrorhamnose 3,5-epimerase [Actinobacteria bacterium]|nr:dTDP-4-dehydrorhamnose 3,5-epimerase [Actinomycetota bacterium]